MNGPRWGATTGRRAGRMIRGLTLAAALGLVLAAGGRPGRAAGPAGNPAIGLAHVDLMDLHAERAGGGVRARELLPAPDLADRFARAGASGAAWNRWSLYWDLVEQTGRRDWSVADGIVRRDVAAGLRTLAILQGTPPELATAGQAGAQVPRVGGQPASMGLGLGLPWALAPQASPPRGLAAPIFRRRGGGLTDDPALAEAVNPDNPWAAFVDAAVARYAPGGELARSAGWAAGQGVRAWEVGNEPNLAFFWSGTAADFARYLEVAYLAIKRRDPEALVLHGGIADAAGASDWFGRFLDALKARAAVSELPARHGWYFDKTAWHWYTYPSLLQTGPDKVRGLLAAKGLPAKPVWVTEMGVPIWDDHPGPCWDPVSPWRATAVEQAGYIWQALAEGLAAGVETQVVFQLYDDCGNGPASYDAFGLVRNHAGNQCWVPPSGQACWRLDPARAGQPRPGYEALGAAARELAGASLLWRPPREAEGWQRLLFYRPPDRRVMLLWNHYRTSRTVEVYPTGPEASRLELTATGEVLASTLRPEGGRLRLSLPGATNRNNPGNQSPVMAGRPVIVVERDAYGPFRAQLAPLPAQSPPTFDLLVGAADGGTGVGAVRVLVAERAPTGAGDWRPLVDERAWTAAPLSGEMRVSVSLAPGRAYWFGAQARDRAGNWSAPPAAAQANTFVAGTPPPPSATPPPTAPPPPSATPGPRPPLPFALHLPYAGAAIAAEAGAYPGPRQSPGH